MGAGEIHWPLKGSLPEVRQWNPLPDNADFLFPWAPANGHWHSLYEDKVLVWLEDKFHQSNVV